MFNHLYSAREVLDTPHGQLIQQQFPQLPAELVTTLLLRTSPQELDVMSREQRIPLRLKNLARELANEVRASHASEGLHDDALLTPDTERMVLNLLRLNTDALGDLSIAIHEQSPEGALRCRVGPEAAAHTESPDLPGSGPLPDPRGTGVDTARALPFFRSAIACAS